MGQKPKEIFRVFGDTGQWREEGQCPVSSLAVVLACLAYCQGVCAELGLGPGRGQSWGGPFSPPAGRRCHGHFRCWQAWGAGLSAPHMGPVGQAFMALKEPQLC